MIAFFVLILSLVLSFGSCEMEPILVVHGGAGDIPDSRDEGKIVGVRAALAAGYHLLKNGSNVLDAVEAAVKVMEDDENFNAGFGSVLNLDGEVEMDASIMLGRDLSAGAVTVVKDVEHPISLARLVMEKTPHLLLAGQGASRFAREQCVPIVPPETLVSKNAQEALEAFKKHRDSRTEIGKMTYPTDVGTVGAVAIDSRGRLAAATSTGGINGKMVGRSSDTSMIGSGTYADDEIGAVSTTGHGETIAKYCLAHSILKEMETGTDAQTATVKVLDKMTARLKNTAGAITLSKTGDIGIGFTSKKMAWGYRIGNKIHYGVRVNENCVQTLEED